MDINKLKTKAAEIRKLLVSVVGMIALLVSAGVLTGPALVVATAVIAIASAVGVYKVPNAPPKA